MLLYPIYGPSSISAASNVETCLQGTFTSMFDSSISSTNNNVSLLTEITSSISSDVNSIRTKKSIEDCDLVIVKFGEKYKQWNAAFDTGYASALNKSIIVIHSDEHQHPLKEVDASASAVAKDQKQAFRILKYILDGSL